MVFGDDAMNQGAVHEAAREGGGPTLVEAMTARLVGTRGLRRDFGERVFDTPISESAILGSAVGAAMLGRRPIVEIMWADFSRVAFDQVVNQQANVHYVSRGELRAPVVVRTQQGSAPRRTSSSGSGAPVGSPCCTRPT
jgi:pyruvate/2-oxoglutarate/acetoin dehydrogenase E1 component